MPPLPEPAPLPCNLSAPALVLVAKDSARRLVFERADALRKHREVPLTLASHPDQAVVPRSSVPEGPYFEDANAWLVVKLGVEQEDDDAQKKWCEAEFDKSEDESNQLPQPTPS